MNFKVQSLALTLLLVTQFVNAMENVIEIIPVYHRPAEELIPVLQPLLEPGDHIVANGENLIVKTLPERIRVLTNLVRKLDSPMTNLLVSVVQSHDVTASELNAGLGGQVNIPYHHPSASQGGINGYVNQYQGGGRNQQAQTIRTLEGQPAHIRAGNAYPLTNYQSYPDPYGYPAVSQSTQYFEATTGFTVTPRLTGQQVTLEVAPWSERLTNQGQFQIQETQTQIRVNLGEWVEIGSVDESEQASGGGISGYTNQTSQNRLRVLVKVEAVH